MSSPQEVHQNIVFGFVRAIFLLAVAFFLVWTVLGIADVSLDLQWGYSWQMVLAGPALALVGYGGYRFIGVIEKFVAGIRS